MERTTLTRLKIELESFKVLATANMIGAALTLAFSIAYGITELIPFITGGPLEPSQIPYLMVVISGFATAIAWITRSAELMGEHDEITQDLSEILASDLGEEALGEAVTNIIIRSLGFYRENNEKIDRLKWGGRLTGVFLSINGILQLNSFLYGGYPVEGWAILAQGFAIIASLGVSIAAWYVPLIIERFKRTWDTRLNLADDASEKLKGLLEDE